ncbi:porin family protein [uncultured Parabacteroides sp.]|uniref:porin family protein n=1 Tax=uncultured Parabacteroides sp. TaxID=512312 RepID=UPI00259BD7B9|nr:porin family protein [uncultured Parabacteroides sp.]
MIRKITIISFLCLAVITGITAQKKFVQEITVGASFGMNFSSVSFNPKVYTKMKQGYNGGLVLRWNTEKNLGLQTELNFSQQGWDEQFDEHPTYKYTRTINYLEIPFFTHIYFGSNKFKFYVNMGPKVGFAIGEKTDLNPDEKNLNAGANNQHDMAIQKKFDWGLCGGPGIELRTGIGYFLLEGRYYYALGDIFNNRKSDYFNKSASQVISARLIYLLPIRK